MFVLVLVLVLVHIMLVSLNCICQLYHYKCVGVSTNWTPIHLDFFIKCSIQFEELILFFLSPVPAFGGRSGTSASKTCAHEHVFSPREPTALAISVLDAGAVLDHETPLQSGQIAVFTCDILVVVCIVVWQVVGVGPSTETNSYLDLLPQGNIVSGK